MRRKLAFLFPGQGSQAVGMAAHTEASEASRSLLGIANSVLDYDLRGMMVQGPEDELKKTENTQPALFVASAATLVHLRDAGIKPYAVAGHSLGEYSALYAAGVFGYEDGLRLVRTRGLAFAEAGTHRPGTMAAIIGLESQKIREICQTISAQNGAVVVANYNEPMQTVISGELEGVKTACAMCTEAGAKRALPLPVSGAFHSPLVSPAAEAMDLALRDVELHKPACVVVNNVDADVIDEPLEIRRALIQQITSSVRWVESIKKLVDLGIEEFVEVGSGKVLAGLCKRIDRDIVCHTTDNADSLAKTIEALKQ